MSYLQGEMRSSGEVRLFRIGNGSQTCDFSVVFTEDYKIHVLKTASDLGVNKTVIGINLQLFV